MAEPVPHAVRRVVLAWALILICLGVVVARNTAAEAHRAANRHAAPGPERAVDAGLPSDPGIPGGPELQMRYLVGMHVLAPHAPMGQAADAMVAEIGVHGSERDRLSLVPVLGELQGDGAAQEQERALDRQVWTAGGRLVLNALHALYPLPPAPLTRVVARTATGSMPVSATGAAATTATSTAATTVTTATGAAPDPATAEVVASGPAPVSATLAMPTSGMPAATATATAAARAPAIPLPPMDITSAEAVVLKNLGWAGQLAVGHGDPGGTVEATALATGARMAESCMVFLFIGIAALVCAVGFLVAISRGTLICAYTAGVGDLDTGRHPVWVEVFALYLTAFLATGEILHTHDWGTADATLGATWIFIAVAPLLYGVLRLAGMDRARIRAALGWHTGAGVITEMIAGIGGWLAGAPVVVVMAMLAGVMSRRLGFDLHPDHPLVGEALSGHGWGHWLILASVASVFAPVVEETMFRGALFHSLRGWFAWPVAALIGGLLFAALHPQGLAAIPPLCAMAIIFTAIRTWRGTLIANVTAHACNNGMVLLVLWCVQS